MDRHNPYRFLLWFEMKTEAMLYVPAVTIYGLSVARAATALIL